MGEEAMTKSNPEKPAPVGPRARAGQARLLTSHVPIRFRPQTIDRAKVIAERDGMTVSSWIRTVVEREVERRMPASPHTRLSESGTSWRVVHYDNPGPEVETKNPDYDPRHAQLESV
jgi:hypothetical protein